jgi:hypothetical protein
LAGFEFDQPTMAICGLAPGKSFIVVRADWDVAHHITVWSVSGDITSIPLTTLRAHICCHSYAKIAIASRAPFPRFSYEEI